MSALGKQKEAHTGSVQVFPGCPGYGLKEQMWTLGGPVLLAKTSCFTRSRITRGLADILKQGPGQRPKLTKSTRGSR